ncbi:hypothetical protein [Clostridium brassicae]|uniref:Uncharacterized protein n=1 Tax=Clostridium brassicae TaxID=2999072 RepID=A0ABT4DCT7_9CLOT|nr:hypothetical protein [Clostridium brassicae]MCY6958834.1 hypothetical protein [Clostridium brassicae]
MILCPIGNCSEGRTICCLYCLKRKECLNACNRTNQSCYFDKDPIDKKRAAKAAK